MSSPPRAQALHDLSAAEAVALLSRGEVSAEALVRSCLERIAAEEPRVGAWAFLDEELARAVADVAPLLSALGAPLRPRRRAGAPRVGLCRTEQWRLAAAESQEAV